MMPDRETVGTDARGKKTRPGEDRDTGKRAANSETLCFQTTCSRSPSGKAKFRLWNLRYYSPSRRKNQQDKQVFFVFFSAPLPGPGRTEENGRARQSRANHSVNMAATMGAVVVPPESPSSTTAAKLRSSPVFGCVTKPLNQVFLEVSVVRPTSAVPVFA